jgi:hypothetical protein
MTAILKSHRLRQCRNGSAAIEFAIVAPLLMILLFTIIEFGLIFFANVTLDGAAAKASRIGKTNYFEGQDRDTYLRAMVKDMSAGLLDPDLLTIDLLWYGDINRIGEPEQCLIASCDANSPPGTYVDEDGSGNYTLRLGEVGAGSGGVAGLYTLTYPWPLFSPIMHAIYSDDTVTLTATAVVKNENF